MCPFSSLLETDKHNFVFHNLLKRTASIASNVISFKTVSAVVVHHYSVCKLAFNSLYLRDAPLHSHPFQRLSVYIENFPKPTGSQDSLNIRKGRMAGTPCTVCDGEGYRDTQLQRAVKTSHMLQISLTPHQAYSSRFGLTFSATWHL